ncbi:MAG: HAD hydrolase family protein [candidate division Zixibacteria bacterium]|nr:HAD hydrolase family protein [candidate division Zixibacteria bacterium]
MKRKLKKIKLLLLDVDGVLTDNSIYLGDDGKEIKKFNVSDGLGIYFLRKAGIKVAFLSGRVSESARLRGKELKVDELHFGISNKLQVYQRLKRKLRLKDEEILYMGDDLLDYEIFEKAGLPVGIKNGDSRINRKAFYVTEKRGGEGAVREVSDLILVSKNINPMRFLR